MKNLIVLFLTVVVLSSISLTSQNTGTCSGNSSIVTIQDWVEYVLIGEQWYQITHHDNGDITIVPVAKPPVD